MIAPKAHKRNEGTRIVNNDYNELFYLNPSFFF